MNLLTKELRQMLIDAGDAVQRLGEADPQRVALVKFFDPAGRWTFYAFEAEEDTGDDPDMRIFGYCVSALGADCDEWGYASFHEIRETTNRFGGHMERDLHFRGGLTAERIEKGDRP